jgi:CrcB protein
MQIIIVMTAGALGALARWATDLLTKHLFGPAFPIGTLTVNVLGCFAFGLIMQSGIGTNESNKLLKLFLTTGFLGAFTTFSTFGFNTFDFIKNGSVALAIINISANLLLGLLAVWGGFILGKTLFT